MRLNSIINAATRRIEKMFPGLVDTQIKHNYQKDFGYPSLVTHQMARQMFSRNGIAQAAIAETVGKCWENKISLVENDDPEPTPLETEANEWFRRNRVWQSLMRADARSLVSGYSFLIFRFRDGLPLEQPVGNVGGFEGLFSVRAVWRDQMRVVQWEEDTDSENYGDPLLYEYQEYRAGEHDPNRQTGRSVKIHASRVMIWSDDGTLDNPSALEAGYNHLINIEKIDGAGGEGFWKNAKGAPVLQVDKDAKIKDMAAAMGVGEEEVVEKMAEQVDDFNKGFDSMLMLQGITAQRESISLTSPQHFFKTSCMSFAASFRMPMKILLGSQTGERASTEDSSKWSKTSMSRRDNTVQPNVETFLDTLRNNKILSEKLGTIEWPDLTESSTEEKLEKAKGMADVNSKGGNEITFSHEEIREVLGYRPLTTEEMFRDE